MLYSWIGDKPTAKAFRRASPKAMREFSFPAGSMGPKVEAACHFAEATGKRAAIGALKDLKSMLCGEAGTTVDAGRVLHSVGCLARLSLSGA